MSTIDIKSQRFIELFMFETKEYFDELDGILLANEKKDGLSPEDIDVIFRIMHTVKGTAATMGYDTLASLAHRIEDIFSELRENNSSQNDRKKELFDLLFNALEVMRHELERPQNEGSAPVAYDALTMQINKYLQGAASMSIIHVTLENNCRMENARAFVIASNIRSKYGSIEVFPENLENFPSLSKYIHDNGFYLVCQAKDKKEILEALLDQLYVDGAEEVSALPQMPRGEEGEGSEAQAPPKTAQSENIVNVHISRLDKLQNITGELVIAEAIAESAIASSDAWNEQSKAAIRHLKKLTDELRGVIMSIRMTPVANLFQKMHRVVRDTAKKLGREVEFETFGIDIEADKGIIDMLGDVLSHVVRNAVAHGIEPPEERIAAGKPPVGKVTLTAKNTGSGIMITVSDDGRGIETKQVLRAAENKGIILSASHTLTNNDLLNLIMSPGVTTSGTLSEESGRGVGLDAVREAVERMKGRVSLSTEDGKGTSFFINIPQTLAIMDCLSLEASGSVFMIPVPDVYKIVIPEREKLIEYPDGRSKILFHGYTIPMLRLDRMMKMPQSEKEFESGIIIVIEGETNAVAVYADRLVDQRRVVIKSLPRLLRSLDLEKAGISGCTILGDGSICLIIDAEVALSLAPQEEKQ